MVQTNNSRMQTRRLLGLRQTGLSIRNIANMTNVSRRTVSLWLQRFEETGACKRKDGTGLNNTKTTAAQDANLALAAFENHFDTAYEIKHRVGIGNLTDRTVRNKIRKLTGMKSRVARVKQALTEENQAANTRADAVNESSHVDVHDRVLGRRLLFFRHCK